MRSIYLKIACIRARAQTHALREREYKKSVNVRTSYPFIIPNLIFVSLLFALYQLNFLPKSRKPNQTICRISTTNFCYCLILSSNTTVFNLQENQMISNRFLQLHIDASFSAGRIFSIVFMLTSINKFLAVSISITRTVCIR